MKKSKKLTKVQSIRAVELGQMIEGMEEYLSDMEWVESDLMDVKKEYRELTGKDYEY